eukprot:gene5440-7533_t
MNRGCLNNKQQWRKQPHRSRIQNHDLYYSLGAGNEDHWNSSRPLSELSLDYRAPFTKTWATTGSIIENNKTTIRLPRSSSKFNKNRIKFSSILRVVLIPTLEEYKATGLDSYLWWNNDDFILFKTEAMSDLARCLAKFDQLDIKDAKWKLYQTDYELSPLPTATMCSCSANGDVVVQAQQDDDMDSIDSDKSNFIDEEAELVDFLSSSAKNKCTELPTASNDKSKSPYQSPPDSPITRIDANFSNSISLPSASNLSTIFIAGTNNLSCTKSLVSDEFSPPIFYSNPITNFLVSCIPT